MTIRVLKAIVFVLCLVPAGMLAWGAYHGTLGANPVSEIQNTTGVWTLRFLMIVLAITPVRKLAALPSLIRFRRMLGLFAFFYGTLHLVTYLWLDQFFDVHEIVHDIAKRPFISAGMTAFALMIPLAVTSTTRAIRRLGGRTWQRLHRLVYLSATAGVVHYWWLVKADLFRPKTYAAILAALLAYRVGRALLNARSHAPAALLSSTRLPLA